MSDPTPPTQPSPTTTLEQRKDPRERRGAPAWIQAVSFAVIALCVLVLTVDLLYMQYLLDQAVDDLRREFKALTEGLGGVFGGGAEPQPDGAPDCTDPFAPGC